MKNRHMKCVVLREGTFSRWCHIYVLGETDVISTPPQPSRKWTGDSDTSFSPRRDGRSMTPLLKGEDGNHVALLGGDSKSMTLLPEDI